MHKTIDDQVLFIDKFINKYYNGRVMVQNIKTLKVDQFAGAANHSVDILYKEKRKCIWITTGMTKSFMIGSLYDAISCLDQFIQEIDRKERINMIYEYVDE